MLENTRKCKICENVFLLSAEFFPKRGEKSYRKQCISCYKKIQLEYRIKNREKINKKFEEYRNNNKKLISERNKQSYLKKTEERKLYSKIYYRNNKEHINEHRRNNLEKNYSKYKSSAKRRKINFELTEEEFSTLWNKDCSYCGSKIENIGIDRIDNNVGYTKNNCVSCCIICNKMKLNLSLNEWYEHMKKIISLHTKQMAAA